MPPVPEQQRLSDKEFEEVVEEIAKNEADAGNGVSLDQAREALRELDLPADKLDDAALKVRQRREAEALAQNKKKRAFMLGGGVLAVLLTAGASFGMWKQAETAKFTRITASDAVLNEESGQLKLSAKLMSAPLGESIPMSCSWQTPDGKLLHENAWKTKPVSHDAWETHCVLQKGPEHVRVIMKARDRVVAESSR